MQRVAIYSPIYLIFRPGEKKKEKREISASNPCFRQHHVNVTIRTLKMIAIKFLSCLVNDIGVDFLPHMNFNITDTLCRSLPMYHLYTLYRSHRFSSQKKRMTISIMRLLTNRVRKRIKCSGVKTRFTVHLLELDVPVCIENIENRVCDQNRVLFCNGLCQDLHAVLSKQTGTLSL